MSDKTFEQRIRDQHAADRASMMFAGHAIIALDEKDAELAALQQSLRERGEQLAAVRKERDSEIKKNGRLQADLMHEDNLRAIKSLMDEHGVCDEGLWASMKRQRDAATARAEAAEREVGRLKEAVIALRSECRAKDAASPYPTATDYWFVARQLDALLAQPGEDHPDAQR
jgi:hypothetical protein